MLLVEYWEKGNRVGWVLTDVYAGRLSGLEDKCVCCFKLPVNTIKGGFREFVFNMDRPLSCKVSSSLQLMKASVLAESSSPSVFF